MEFLNRLEYATAQYTAAYIKAALRVQGTNCLLYKKAKFGESDKVYGIYGGSELSHGKNVSISDSSFVNTKKDDNFILNLSTDEFYSTNLIKDKNSKQDTETTINNIENEEEIPLLDDNEETELEENNFDTDNQFQKPIPIKVILSNFSWKSYTQFEYGTIEDPAYLFTYSDVDIDPSDILNVDLSESRHLRLKVIFIETIGISENMVNRYKITNIGD